MKTMWTGIAVLAAACLCPAGCGGEKACTPNDHTVCKQGEVFWVDSCGEDGEKAGDCECGCNAEFTACKEPCDCVRQCTGRVCGPDGCGGTCGTCQPDETCNPQTGQCEGCNPACTGRCCGDDGCGGACPDRCTETGQTCNQGACLCEGVCTPNCTGKECGPDGCGGSCGGCQGNFACQDGQCVCPNTSCGDLCCDPGEVCDQGACCLPDCAGKQCGTDCGGVSCGACARGSFCQEGTYACVVAGVEDCWDTNTCPPESPNCLFSCNQRATRCCSVVPDHPMRTNATLDDSCEVCCTNPEYPHPVIWPDEAASCCADGAPYPFLSCGGGEQRCCPVPAGPPMQCDGSLDTSCLQCCIDDHPHPVVFPDGSSSCCSAQYPYPCVVGGDNSCCQAAGQCG